MKINTIQFLTLLISLYIFILCSAVVGVLLSIPFEGHISYFDPTLISFISLGLFMIIILFATVGSRWYFFLLIYIFLGFPAAINDFFPGAQISSLIDRGALVYYPFITHIDIYLLFGVILGIIRKEYCANKKHPIPILVILSALLLVYILSLFFFTDLWDFNLLNAGNIHLRYLILLLMLFTVYDVNKYKKFLIYGLFLALVLIVCEASIYTLKEGTRRFVSGNLGVNTFANIFTACLFLFIELRRKKMIPYWIFLVTLALVVFVIIGSETRGAVVSLLISFLIIFLLDTPKKFVQNLFKVSVFVIFIIISYVQLSKYHYIPDRYSVYAIQKRITYKGLSSSINGTFKIKHSPVTNSILTRINLYDSSIEMIKQNPVLGVGPGRWNRYKKDYNPHIDENVLLDSHNDYFSLISQYGIFLGFLLIYYLFIFPLLKIGEVRKSNNIMVKFLLINVVMAVAALSNSGFFKYQVGVFLLFNLVAYLYSQRSLKLENSER